VLSRRLLLLVVPVLALACGPAENRAGKPQNGLIATRHGDGIVLLASDGSSRGTVPGTEAADEAVWSPEGDRLAFTVGSSDLYVIGSDGKDRRRILRNGWDPSWSPDAKRLAITRDSCPDADEECFSAAGWNSSDLYTVAADGTDLSPLVAEPNYQGDGAWSPDGEWIAFTGSDPEGLYLIRPDGTDRTLLAGGEDAFFGDPSWSPDGSRIVLEDRAEITVVDVKTRKQTILPRRGYDFAPEWSPDGKQIAFLANSRCSKTDECTAHEPWEVWVMDIDGKNARPITKGGFGRPSWAPAPAPSVD